MIKKKINNYLSKSTESVTLAVFRIFFGLLMLMSIIRFWRKGWIELLYVKPDFFFSYYGFEFIKPIGEYTYWVFAICGVSAFLVMIGYKFRLAIITLFLSFTYIELMDKTNYLNHYYFVSLMSLVLCFLPANSYFSLDAYLNKNIKKQFVPKFTVDVIKFLLGIVYFYAGLAKLNSDWMLRASPLNIWLPVRNHFYLVGDLMHQTWFHYAMSWSGALYDLFIPFLLVYKKTRKLAFATVVFFHIFTRILFPIGMFPYIMIVATIIFFEPKVHHKIIAVITKVLQIVITFVSIYFFKSKKFNFRINKEIFNNGITLEKLKFQKIIVPFFVLFFAIQLLFPFRNLLYPGELFWTEEGYRFSWRVMLIEKAGYAEFKVVDKQTNKVYYIDNSDYLTNIQEKQMSFQPDFIVQYAHYLGDTFKRKGVENPEVYIDSYVTLNGRLSTKFIKEDVNLYQEHDSFKHKDWIVPFTHPIKIKGL